MYRMIRIMAGLILVGSMTPAPVQGQGPEVLFSVPEEHTLSVVEHLPLTVGPYQPSYVLQPARKGAASDTPESALAGWLGAIAAGDSEWLARSFDEASRPSSSADSPAAKQFLEYYFLNRRVELLHRLEVEGRLLIELASFDRDSGERLFKTLIQVREVAGAWRLSDLPTTPVFAKLVTDFDPEVAHLTIDLGLVMRTSRP